MFEQTDSAEQKQLETAIRAHYTNYYRDQLGLPDWLQRVESRLDEENVFAKRVLDWIQSWINYSFTNKRVLVVGGGTGAETFALQARGADVVAIEPNSDAVRILAAKARIRFKVANPAVQAVAEALPYRDEHFDFVYCYTVLEHTKNPVCCIDEMIRVVRRGGWVFIETPDYRQFYEPHYKVTMPMFAPKWLLRLWLQVLRRPSEFLNSLQFVNSKSLTNIFQQRPVTAFQIIHSWPDSWLSHPTTQTRLIKWMTEAFGIQRDQFWLLQKLERPR